MLVPHEHDSRREAVLDKDCKVDLACCAESKTCVRLERDACAEKTAAERKKRDGK